MGVAMKRPREIARRETPAWSALRLAGGATIEAYFEQGQAWQPIAECLAAPRADRKATAKFILRAIEHHQSTRLLVPEAVAALELCLECQGLSWAAEHDAEIVLARARKLGW